MELNEAVALMDNLADNKGYIPTHKIAMGCIKRHLFESCQQSGEAPVQQLQAKMPGWGDVTKKKTPLKNKPTPPYFNFGDEEYFGSHGI